MEEEGEEERRKEREGQGWGGREAAADYLHLSPRVWPWLHLRIVSSMKPEPPQAFPVLVCAS